MTSKRQRHEVTLEKILAVIGLIQSDSIRRLDDCIVEHDRIFAEMARQKERHRERMRRDVSREQKTAGAIEL